MTSLSDDDRATALEEDGADEAPEKMNLEVNIESPSTGQRHITVTVPRDDIDRYFEDAFSELMGSADVPGFRQGRAPRQLIEQRFRKDVAGQVKGSVLMDSISQVTEDEELAAISEPDFDFEAVVVPDEGPLTFEFDIEVRPEFDLPKWKGLKLERPVRDFGNEDINRQMEKILAPHGRLVPLDAAAELGDYVVANLAFKNGDETVSSSEEETIRIKPVLSFRDGKVEDFDKLLAGVKAGDTRTGEVQLSDDAPNEELRGKKIAAQFEVLDVKRLELPELTSELLSEFGDFESEGDMRDMIRDSLERQLNYHRQQKVREQITAQLTESASWDLPPEMLKKQADRELERAVMELRRNGFSEDDIRAHSNDLRQNSSERTARALKEHFILERVADDEDIDATSEDYELEITMIAAQSGQSARRVRARLEKGGMMDSLRNQVIERKVIELIEQAASITEIPFEYEPSDTEAVEWSAGGHEDSNIPEAQHGGDAQSLKEPKDHT